MKKTYQDINAKTIDRWCLEGWQWGKPIDMPTFKKAKQGQWDVLLTPTKVVPKSWFLPFKDLKILGLASGGAQQMPIFAALGANCTVLDYSDHQLNSERAFAKQANYDITIIKADMSQPLPFGDETFDLIFHPVSNCYIEAVKPLFKECFRILKPQGRLLSGLDNGMNYIADQNEEKIVHALPFNPLKDEKLFAMCEQEDVGIQFSHTLEEQITGQLEAGFILKDLYEDTNGMGRLHELNIPSYIATLSLKP